MPSSQGKNVLQYSQTYSCVVNKLHPRHFLGAIIDNIARQFSNAAKTYDNAAHLEQEVGNRLLERLNNLNFTPSSILDLGCGTGHFIPQLQNKYNQASIIGLDFAKGMLKFATKHGICLEADATKLPFANASVDLIFCNCCIPHLPDPELLFNEVKRVLTTHGLFVFTTYGPDTLSELGFQGHWPDMHVAGDLLLRLGFVDPVVDNEVISFNYADATDLYLDLQETGAFILEDIDRINTSHSISVNYEIVYGLAWGAKESRLQNKNSDTFYIEVTR